MWMIWSLQRIMRLLLIILKTKFLVSFRVKDRDKFKHFFSLKTARSKQDIIISQKKSTLDILDDTILLGTQFINFPIELNIQLNL